MYIPQLLQVIVVLTALAASWQRCPASHNALAKRFGSPENRGSICASIATLIAWATFGFHVKGSADFENLLLSEAAEDVKSAYIISDWLSGREVPHEG